MNPAPEPAPTPREGTPAAPDFDTGAAAYAAFRPQYPPALYEWLLGLVPARHLAWDVGTGSGQVARALAPHFAKVLATDLSAAQLTHAPTLPNVIYRAAPAERSGLAPASADLVVAGQAAHWFDLAPFYDEVRRVARPGAVLALWGYAAPRAGRAAVDANLDYFEHQFLGPYWNAGRAHIDGRYRQLPFPFAEIEAPPLAISAEFTLAQLVGYLSSWSALAAYRRAHSADPLPDMQRRLAECWPGAAELAVAFRFELFCRAGRVS